MLCSIGRHDKLLHGDKYMCMCVPMQVQANTELQTSLQHAQQHATQIIKQQDDLQRLQAELHKVQVGLFVV